MPPRFSPREWLDDPKSFGDHSQLQTWRQPATVDEARQLLVAYNQHESCSEVREALVERGWTAVDFAEVVGERVETLRRKLNGELVARPEDVLFWALLLGRPEVVFAPGRAEDLIPPGVDGAFAQLGL